MGSDPNQEEYIMSEQEKNTTPAQNAAPAAPKPPKIDNAALKRLLRPCVRKTIRRTLMRLST